MKSKNILWRKTNIIRHLTDSRKIILSIPAIILLAFSIILPVANTSAESFQSSESVQFNLNPSISINISGNLVIESLTPGDYKDSNVITVTAESNAIAGYSLTSTVGTINNASNELRLDGTSTTNKFTNLSSNAATLANFNDNNWGYSYSLCSTTECTNTPTWVSGDTGNTTSGYNGYTYDSSTSTSGTITHLVSSTNGSSAIQYKIGAKASGAQLAGNYINAINFIGVANPNPEPIYMQEVTLTDCGKAMVDKRDHNIYTTTLIGNTCWMTRNLDLSGGSTITNEDSNITASSYTLPASSTDFDGSSANVNNSNSTTCEDGSPCYSYYDYTAATAGTGDMSSDICPKGWRLPFKTEFDALVSVFKTGAELTGNTWQGVYTGYYYYYSFGGGSEGFYWASDAYALNFTSGGAGVYPYDSSEGMGIRCVLQ